MARYKLGEKKSCYGCRALSLERCDLGYSVKMELKPGDLCRRPVPINRRCPKPRTYDKLGELLSEKEARDD